MEPRLESSRISLQERRYRKASDYLMAGDRKMMVLHIHLGCLEVDDCMDHPGLAAERALGGQQVAEDCDCRTLLGMVRGGKVWYWLLADQLLFLFYCCLESSE